MEKEGEITTILASETLKVMVSMLEEMMPPAEALNITIAVCSAMLGISVGLRIKPEDHERVLKECMKAVADTATTTSKQVNDPDFLANMFKNQMKD